jgi:hypothetical protein
MSPLEPTKERRPYANYETKQLFKALAAPSIDENDKRGGTMKLLSNAQFKLNLWIKGLPAKQTRRTSLNPSASALC